MYDIIKTQRKETSFWKLQDYWDWKEYRLNPLTGEKN